MTILHLNESCPNPQCDYVERYADDAQCGWYHDCKTYLAAVEEAREMAWDWDLML